MFCTTIDRLTKINHFIKISAKVNDSKGIFSIGVESDSIAVKSKFTDLELKNQMSSGESQSNNSQTNTFKVRIDAKNLNLVLNSLISLKPSSITCSLVNRERIHFQFFHNYVNFQLHIPNVSD
jgi:hypothetical protein